MMARSGMFDGIVVFDSRRQFSAEYLRSRYTMEAAGQSVRVNIPNPKGGYGPYSGYPQNPKQSANEFVYVNNAYVGSVASVNSSRLYEPPTTVIREQYWACSKWSFAQRVLALAVGVLLGTVIGLSIIIAIKGENEDITDIFRRHSAPD